MFTAHLSGEQTPPHSQRTVKTAKPEGMPDPDGLESITRGALWRRYEDISPNTGPAVGGDYGADYIGWIVPTVMLRRHVLLMSAFFSPMAYTHAFKPQYEVFQTASPKELDLSGPTLPLKNINQPTRRIHIVPRLTPFSSMVVCPVVNHSVNPSHGQYSAGSSG
ncbi:hypothetical protein CPB85DRAFT_1256823 [Mucidula mucida]|nr:hypothetical protein CPB85DRAFT_1256823 [Mucidula mucida]